MSRDLVSCTGNFRQSGKNRARVNYRRIALLILAGAVALSTVGCGTTKQHDATAQLLASDAVDLAVARIDFAPLAGQKVFLDTQFLRDHKNVGFVNAQYVISALRQQMVAAGLLLYDDKEQADYIVEARLGTLGTDESEVIYGIPASNGLGAAASVVSAVSQVPAPPGIPEISFARRKEQLSAAKIGAFAYDRLSRERVWQSGLSVARSNAKDTWVLGAGPFQRGSIHGQKLRFAGEQLDVPIRHEDPRWTGSAATYRQRIVFQHLRDPNAPGGSLQETVDAAGTASLREEDPGSAVQQTGATQPYEE